MATEKVSVLVSDEYLDRFPEIVQQCRSAGMQVDQQLEDVGVFTGSIESEKIPQLEKTEGISAVELSRDYQIAPPDSSVQAKDDRKRG